MFPSCPAGACLSTFFFSSHNRHLRSAGLPSGRPRFKGTVYYDWLDYPSQGLPGNKSSVFFLGPHEVNSYCTVLGESIFYLLSRAPAAYGLLTPWWLNKTAFLGCSLVVGVYYRFPWGDQTFQTQTLGGCRVRGWPRQPVAGSPVSLGFKSGNGHQMEAFWNKTTWSHSTEIKTSES